MVSLAMERALQFLRNHKDVALATSKDNIPKLRIFQVMKQEGNVLYFATSEKKAVWRELRKNPNVELIAYEGNISVRCSGMVNFNVEDATKRWIYEHRSAEGRLQGKNDVLRRLYPSYDQMAYFCLPIAEMDYYDLQPTPPEMLHFDLMAGEVTSNLI